MKLKEFKMKLLRWDTKEVIFELECSSWEQLLKGALKEKISFHRADFSGSDFSGSNFRNSNFSGSDFSDSDFRNSSFRYSDFSGSNSRNSNFKNSNWENSRHQYKIGNMREWKSMQLDTYMIVFNKRIMAIGCQQYTIDEWKQFTDEKISEMDKKSLEWWNKWKDFIFKAIELSAGSK